MTAAPEVIPVRTPSRGYEVVVGAGLLDSAAARIRGAVGSARRVHVIVDDGVPAQTGAALVRGLEGAGIRVSSAPVRATEEGKSLQAVHQLVQGVAAAGLERGDCVVALGGGVTGDMAGFAAAVYRRGIAWVNCPTTLLAMVDASVGGKTGVNLRVGAELQKNMAGAFWQPSLVLADVSVLGSLEERVFRAGLAECIKHGMLSAAFGDAELGHWTKANLGGILRREPGVMVELVARNVGVKARVVGMDEREEAAGMGAGLVEPWAHVWACDGDAGWGIARDGSARAFAAWGGGGAGAGVCRAVCGVDAAGWGWMYGWGEAGSGDGGFAGGGEGGAGGWGGV